MMKRMISLLAACCLLLTLVPLFAQADETDYLASEWEVIKLTNRERYRNGLKPLTTQEILFQAADIRASELAERMEHVRPDGSEFSTVFFDVGYPWADSDENISGGQCSAAEAVNAWMEDPEQREKILNKEWDHIGVGCAWADGGDGPHWAQLLTTGWDCGYTAIELNVETLEVERGTSLDDVQLWATVACAYCGNCYLPILPEYCSGYDSMTPGTQTVTVSCLGFSDTLEITVTGTLPDTGDCNGDGRVTALDAVVLRQYLAGWEVSVDPASGDCNGDGRVTALDAVILRQYLAGWDVTLGGQT